MQVGLGSGSALPVEVGEGRLRDEMFPGIGPAIVEVIDEVHGYAYIGTNDSPGRVLKVALGVGCSPLKYVGSITLEQDENVLPAAIIDPLNGYCYFGTNTYPSYVVKVALGSGSALPSRVGAGVMESSDGSIMSGVIDTANGYGYFGTDNAYPGVVIKVALGTGSSPPYRVGAVTLATNDESQLYSAAIDVVNGYAYFAVLNNPTIVIKVALGSGSSPPVEVGAVTLEHGEGRPWNGLGVDNANGFAYVGTQIYKNNYIIKVSLGSGSSPPVRVAALAMKPDEITLRGFGIDHASGYCYFVASRSPNAGRLIQIALDSSNVSAPVRTADAYLSTSGATDLKVDQGNGFAYVLNSFPNMLVKVYLKPVCGASPKSCYSKYDMHQIAFM